MDQIALDLLHALVALPTPTGFEHDGMALLSRYLKQAAVPHLAIDVHGNLRACLNPDAPLRVMIEGHCDEIGFMVQYIDDDGFLYIEGRLSRFSKIGGEMVSHERVEEYIVKVLGLEGEETRKLAVVGVPDPAKGEALVLLSTTAGEYLEQEMVDLRYRLLEMNVPALWIPRKMVKVPEIPMLASGKLDLRACEAVARQFSGE